MATEKFNVEAAPTAIPSSYLVLDFDTNQIKNISAAAFNPEAGHFKLVEMYGEPGLRQTIKLIPFEIEGEDDELSDHQSIQGRVLSFSRFDHLVHHGYFKISVNMTVTGRYSAEIFDFDARGIPLNNSVVTSSSKRWQTFSRAYHTHAPWPPENFDAFAPSTHSP